MNSNSALSKTPFERLAICDFKGSSLRLGQQYGEHCSGLIEGFYAQECTPNEKKLLYAAECLPLIRRFAPESNRFLEGMAQATKLSLKDATLLTLHEELYHSRFDPSHCTAIVVPPRQSRTRSPYVAQNWDWQPQLSPWAGMLRMRWSRDLSTLTYQYPGLWACCGINSAGLALMWTGAGYFPSIKPSVGLPTYIITSELIRRKSVHEALEFLRKVPKAGPFMFLLGDAGGECALVEATPNHMRIENVDTVAYRANLYEFADVIKVSKQVLDTKKIHSSGRMKAITGYLARHQRPVSLTTLKDILSLPAVRVHKPLKSVTVDQLIADCRARRLFIRRNGISSQHRWMEYGFE